MPLFGVAALLALSITATKQSGAVRAAQEMTQQAQSETQAQSPSPQAKPQLPAPQDQTNNPPIAQAIITLPAGTRIQLALTSPITNRNARVGYAVRAAVVFPVAVGSQLAIPVGTYLEGVVDRVKGHDAYGRPGVEVHFTRMIFANGYTVPLDSATSPISENRGEPLEAEPGVREAYLPAAPTVLSRALRSGDFAESEEETGAVLGTRSYHVPPMPSAANFLDTSYAVPPQIQQPQPPPLPHVGPPTGLFIGVGVAAAVAVVVVALVARRGTTTVFYGAGWQFEIALEAPVSLDASAVAAAAATP